MTDRPIYEKVFNYTTDYAILSFVSRGYPQARIDSFTNLYLL